MKKFLAKENISKIQIPVDKIFDELMALHGLEGYVGSYRADVVSKNVHQQIIMAWEIVVSQELEQEKRDFLHAENIPYIELNPYEQDEDKFAFEVTSYNNLVCLKPATYKLENLMSLYSVELGGNIAHGYIKDFLYNIENLAFDNINPKYPHFRIKLPDALFIDFLMDLMTVAEVDLIIAKGLKGFEAVYDFRISGIYSIKAFNLAMRASVVNIL